MTNKQNCASIPTDANQVLLDRLAKFEKENRTLKAFQEKTKREAEKKLNQEEKNKKKLIMEKAKIRPQAFSALLIGDVLAASSKTGHGEVSYTEAEFSVAMLQGFKILRDRYHALEQNSLLTLQTRKRAIILRVSEFDPVNGLYHVRPVSGQSLSAREIQRYSGAHPKEALIDGHLVPDVVTLPEDVVTEVIT